MNIRWNLLVAMLGSVLASGTTWAQVVPPAEWIWFDEGDPLNRAPAETRYFRRTIDIEHEQAEAEIHITCDDAFVLFVNGREVGRGGDWRQGKVFDLKPFLVQEKNVIAVQATNRGGAAGLVAWLFRRTVPGNHYMLLTDSNWKVARKAAPGWTETDFDDSQWTAARRLGSFGETDRWRGITWNGRADSRRFTVRQGFTVDLVAAPSVTGSVVNITFDTHGRPVISREDGPVFILEDADGDGTYESSKLYTDAVKNCQGILPYDETTYYLVGDGPEGAGLYRLRDTDSDDAADEVELIHKFRGKMGEHGPHAVVAGPDGYLYLCSGNHAWVTATPEPNSPVWGQYEADVLPRYEDAKGHASGIRVPGGTIWRLDPDGKHFTLEAAGFRNQFDFAFNSLGEIFTFDSDMEYDEFLPWYRPVRVCHCPPGAEFGWRSGLNKWPPYYVDSLPATLDIGRGSPCGVVFYNHHAFPKRYRDALFITDWSYGRIFAVHLTRSGATFRGEAEEFVTGRPLNVTDIDVAPDGSLFFSTGGRDTEGGLYRIRYETSQQPAWQPFPETVPLVGQALHQPQPQSAWGRAAVRRLKSQAGANWRPELEATARSPQLPATRRIRALSYLMQFGPEPSLELARALAADRDPELRAYAAVLLARHPSSEVTAELTKLVGDSASVVQRRALEGLIRTGASVPVEKLLPPLSARDRFVRFAARLALERVDPDQLGRVVWDDADPRGAIMGLIALNKLGKVEADPEVAKAAFAKIRQLLAAHHRPTDELDTLRSLELTLLGLRPEDPPDSVEEIGRMLIARFPTGSEPRDRELARIMANMGLPGTIETLLEALEDAGTDTVEQRANAIHYARCLVAITDGWTFPLRKRYLAWFQVSGDWKGPPSYAGYIANFLRDAVRVMSDAERISVLRQAVKYSNAARRIVEQVDEKSDLAYVAVLEAMLESRHVPPPVPRGELLGALGRTGRAEAEAILLQVYNQSAGDRDAVVPALTNFPNTRNWSIFVRALDAEQSSIVRVALLALARIEQKPDGPAAFRATIQAGGRLGEQGGWDAVLLLRQWAGKHFGHGREEWEGELEKWQQWYAETYPGAEAATLARKEDSTHNWTYTQLLAFLEGEGRAGSVEAGRTVYEQAACAKCHRFGQIGTGLGPDLTTLAGRFKRKDTLEAIVYPSRVISDQYKSVLVATKDGRVVTAMRAPDDGDNLVLLLSDASTLRMPKEQVEEIAESKQSIMPDRLINEFRLQEIADLFVFLESGTSGRPDRKEESGPKGSSLQVQ